MRYVRIYSNFDLYKSNPMKTIQLILISCFAVLFTSCDPDENTTGEKALFAVPVVQSLEQIRSSVGILPAKQTQSDGKIYVADNYLFYIAAEEGVHIYDNSDPSAPVNIAFLNIEGVHDIAVKGERLYADNYVDMVVFDISDPQHITVVQTVPNAINFYPKYPQQAEYYDYTVNAGPGELVTGFTIESRERPTPEVITLANGAMEDFAAAGNAAGVGTGGSYARFQIHGNALYTIESWQLNVFNIANADSAFYDKAVYMTEWFGGGEFETLFSQKEFLFVGSTTGMFVINATDEFNPYFMSGFSHATACDPVVVNENTAYITVRGGTSCGAIQDQVNVIDITDMANPTLTSTYLLDQPYGLGVRQNTVYVCCGTQGLKIFNAEGGTLTLENSYADNVTDVIPLASHLIAVGPNTIRQYSYGADYTLQPLSVVNF